MNEHSLKFGPVQSKFTAYTGELMAALLLFQPLLDVLSFFMQDLGATAVTTALRTVLLFVVSLYGFVVSDKKRTYVIFYSVIGGFWLLHMLNCLRSGYLDPVADTAEYLKLVQFPLWTLTFITLFRKERELDYRIVGVLAANFAIILLIIAISFLIYPVYTYDYPDRGMQIGVLGWFGVPNAQSAILAMLVAPLLLWAFRTRKLWVFSACAVLGLGLLFFTGTRLTYYAAILISAAFVVLIFLNRQQYLFTLPLLVVLVLVVAFKGMSPMAQRENFRLESHSIYREKTETIMGEDKDFVYGEQELTEAVKAKITRVYEEVYGGIGVYGNPLLGDLLERFGTETVMEAYHYTTDPDILYDARVKKLKVVDLLWQEKDFLTKLTGFEYTEVYLGDNIYDPENDYPALLYYYGYLGTAAYLLFTAYFLWIALRAFLRNPRGALTMQLGCAAMMYAMALGSAQFSGQSLRKPSVSVYFSLAAAFLYMETHPEHEHRGKMFYERSSVVFRKEI